MKLKRSLIHVVVVLGMLPFLNGCAAVGLTLFGVGAGVATGTSVSYTLDGFAYRTFTASLPQVEKRNADRPAPDGHKDWGDSED